MNPVAIVFWGFMIGVPALATTALVRARLRQRGWVRAEARGVDPEDPSNPHGRGYDVAFQGPSGPVTATLSGPRPAQRNAPHRGEAVLVAYDPADPRRVELVGPWQRGLLVVWPTVLGLVLLGFLLWLRSRP
ncbi:DUF3592 domain-containing protein [Pararoseomonas sp. SCSIO 73927]|uniref:DUF3592 domain-containing protein n=1 Tax=Pararoseomonas sp. SCSIO 73927 TaxID=3114537 RepID=UPI0030CE0360